MATTTNVPGEARLVWPGDLISTGETARLLGVNRATVVRRVKTGKIPVVAQLDEGGSRRAYVFDRNEIMELGSNKNGMANNGASGD